MKRYKERLAMVKKYTAKNRLFSLIAVIVLLFVLVSAVAGRVQNPDQYPQDEEPSSFFEKTEQGHWRFYPIDLVILGVGGGFCTAMIIHERRKAREKLQ